MILYRTPGAWGPGIGANLSAAQVDGNFFDVAQRVQFLELNPTMPIQITSFTSVGNQLYINMSNGATHGPILLPTVRWRPRGSWTPDTVYTIDDLVVGPDSATYLVTLTHNSGTTFSPNANDGAGHQFYSLLLRIPSTTLPPGGVSGTVLTKNSDGNYDYVWRMPTAPEGGETGQMLTKLSRTDGDVGWTKPSIDDIADVTLYNPLRDGDYLRYSATTGQWVNQARPMFNVLRSSSWAPVIGDEGNFMVLTNGTADTTIFIPPDTEQNFQNGTELHVHQDGTGKTTVVGSEGVSVLRHASFSNVLLGQYATATVKKTNPNEWRLFGLLQGA